LKRKKGGRQAQLQRYKNWRKGTEREKIASVLLIYFLHCVCGLTVWGALYLKFEKYSTLIMTFDSWLLYGTWWAIYDKINCKM
jgi:hypothetical protein